MKTRLARAHFEIEVAWALQQNRAFVDPDFDHGPAKNPGEIEIWGTIFEEEFEEAKTKILASYNIEPDQYECYVEELV